MLGAWRDTAVRCEIWYSTCDVRSLYGAGSLTAAARELARYELGLLRVQQINWGKGGTVRAGDLGYSKSRGLGVQ